MLQLCWSYQPWALQQLGNRSQCFGVGMLRMLLPVCTDLPSLNRQAALAALIDLCSSPPATMSLASPLTQPLAAGHRRLLPRSVITPRRSAEQSVWTTSRSTAARRARAVWVASASDGAAPVGEAEAPTPQACTSGRKIVSAWWLLGVRMCDPHVPTCACHRPKLLQVFAADGKSASENGLKWVAGQLARKGERSTAMVWGRTGGGSSVFCAHLTHTPCCLHSDICTILPPSYAHYCQATPCTWHM